MKETFEQYLQRLKDRRTEDEYRYTDEDFKKYIYYIFDCYEKGMSVYKCLEFMYFAERDMDDSLFNREPKQETENLKNFKKLVSDEISPAMKDFIKEKQETQEYDLLQHIKFCLECNNEAQAIRLIEKYGFVKQEERYTEEEVFEILEGLKDIPRSQFKEEFLKKFKK
jgi:hypothetical protein